MSNDSSTRVPQSSEAALREFVDECIAALADADPAAAVRDVLLKVLAEPRTLTNCLSTDPRGPSILYRSATLSVHRSLLPPGYRTLPHEHRMWSVIGVYAGAEDDILFAKDRDLIVAVSRTLIGDGDVSVGDADAVHAVRNPSSTKWSAALHVYGGDLTGADRTEYAGRPYRGRRFDPHEGTRRYLDAVDFCTRDHGARQRVQSCSS